MDQHHEFWLLVKMVLSLRDGGRTLVREPLPTEGIWTMAHVGLSFCFFANPHGGSVSPLDPNQWGKTFARRKMARSHWHVQLHRFDQARGYIFSGSALSFLLTGLSVFRVRNFRCQLGLLRAFHNLEPADSGKHWGANCQDRRL